jgi:NAD(P)-dependent dehydrogenase (short-subunit alcohol dehydrogenase family)
MSNGTQGLRGRHVVITGGTGALGRSVVAALLAAGATCHVPYVVAAEADAFPFRNDAAVRLVPNIDLTDEAAVERVYAPVPELWASIHLAGGFAMGPITSSSRAHLLGQLEMNLVTCYLCCAAAVRRMGSRGGRIVNVAARPALEWRTGAGMTAYAASKAAVTAFTTALANEVISSGILVNAVAPSILDTPANRAAMPNADHSAWPKTEQVAAAICFLASPENEVTQGAVMPVYGRS